MNTKIYFLNVTNPNEMNKFINNIIKNISIMTYSETSNLGPIKVGKKRKFALNKFIRTLMLSVIVS